MSKKVNEKLKVSGHALWAKVHEPSAPGDFPQAYEIELVVSTETAKALKAKGVAIKKVKELDSVPEELHGKPCIRAKTKYIKKDGTTATPPVVVDSKGNKVKDDIGNGSKVVVATTLVPWQMSGKSGIFVALNGVQVLDLVPYTRKLFDTVEDGFVVSETASAGDIDELVDDDENSPF